MRKLSDTPLMHFIGDEGKSPQNVSDRLYKHVARLSRDWELNEILEHLMARMADLYPDLDPESREFEDLAIAELF